ncbi:MAG: DNA primase [Bacilli bacterium]|nr:DNA primase [Bacilli bacterium]
MEKISYDLILDIKNKVNIVDVINDYLPIEKKGKNYFAICPFHDDHNPSLSISPDKQIYTCFVCGNSGNVFNFVMNYEKVSFTEAVKLVAQKVGITLNTNNKSNVKNIDLKYDKYYKIYDISKKYYQNNLRSKLGIKAIDYLNNRGITDDIIKEFEIGLSLSDNSLSRLLLNKKYSEYDLENIGLIGKKDNFIYDIYRNRIMFPLYDIEGRTVGYSGRIYNDEDENKYLNSKESEIFKKGILLYNYHKAFDYARKKHQIIVVEGFMDVIRLYSVGIKNVVATMGTAITKEQASLIRKLSKNVILCFDGDKAGEKATISCINELNQIDLHPKVIRLEENLDPDEYIIKKGKEKFLLHVKNAISDFDFILKIKKDDTDFNNYSDISKYIKEVAKELEKIDDEIVYELTIKRISKETNVDIDTIKDMIKKIPNKKTNMIINKTSTNTKDKYQKAEEYLIYYMLKSKDAVVEYEKNVGYLNDKLLSEIAMQILEFYYRYNYINTSDFIVFLEDKTDLINEVLRIDDFNLPAEYNADAFSEYIKTIDEGILKKKIKKLKNEIKNEIDVTKKILLLEKLTNLKKECK